MVDVVKLSERALQVLYDKRQAACSVNCTALINAGRGMERGNEIYAKGVIGADPLSIEYSGNGCPAPISRRIEAN